MDFYVRNKINTQNEREMIILLILRYAFTDGVSPEERIEEFRCLLFTAYNVLVSFNDDILFIYQLRQELEFLN